VDEPVNLKKIIDSLDRFLPGNSEVTRALEIARELQHWVSDIDGLSSIPVVSVEIQEGAVSVSIGNIVVWDSESDDEVDLSAAWCQECYQQEVSQLALSARLIEPDED